MAKKGEHVDHSGETVNGWLIVRLFDWGKGKRIWLLRHLFCNEERSGSYFELKYNRVKCYKCAQKIYQNKISCLYFKQIKKNAKDREIEFNISKEYIYDVLKEQNFKCAISGVDINLANSLENELKNRHQTASLDRIDSDIGYVNNNVQWVHKTINKMKCVFSNEEFIWWCLQIVNQNINKLDDIQEKVSIEKLLFQKHFSGSKLSEEDIKNIRKTYIPNKNCKELSDQYEVSKQSILHHIRDLSNRTKIGLLRHDTSIEPIHVEPKTMVGKRSSHSKKKLEYNGIDLFLTDWVEISGIPWHVIYGRMVLGWSSEKIFTTPYKGFIPRSYKEYLSDIN